MFAIYSLIEWLLKDTAIEKKKMLYSQIIGPPVF